MNGGVDWDAVKAGDFSSVTTKEHANARCIWYTAMHHAAQQGNAEAVGALIALGADPDSTTINGTSPAHLAAMSGHHHIVTLLEEAGADLDLVCWGRASVRDLLRAE